MSRKKLYLISGFLGTGKTTLMKHLIGLFSDRKIAIIVNEFGEQGVDGALLAEEGVKVEEISNGSIFCVCRSDLFVDILIQAMHSDAEVVLVETSGLSDPTGMGQILRMVNDLSGEAYDFCGTLVLVESGRFLKLYQNVVAIKQQILSAGLILMNKIDISDPESVSRALDIITEINPVASVYPITFGKIEKAWLDELADTQAKIKGGIVRHTLGVQKMLVAIEPGLSHDLLYKWLSAVSKHTYRIKGFVELDTGRYLVECVGEAVKLTKTCIGGNTYLVILCAGSDRLKKSIAETWRDIFDSDLALM